MKKTVYLDYSATTPQAAEVTRAIADWNSRFFGNPSSQHSFGRTARARIEETRDRLATILRCRPKEITFTSGGTESNNWALIGAARALKNKGNHVIISAVEHPSVLKTAEYLMAEGYDVCYAKPNQDGIVNADEVARLLKNNTVLVSVIHVNNETGVLNPVKEIARLCDENGVCFHCDAVQSFGKLDFTITDLGARLLTLSAHKIYGPKGCGVLVIGDKTPLEPLLHGGGQELGRRPGTENLNGIIGLNAALSLLNPQKDYKSAKALRDYFEKQISETFPFCHINGSSAPRSPYITNISFPGVHNESLLINLDLAGIAVSVGSACSSGSIRPSHVLQAMGLAEELVSSAIRFSFGRDTSPEDIDFTLSCLKEIVPRLRKAN
ncbi:MAG TPA: cysteine desulfurase [Calditrichaeota bacterium]|nr:cysteine desulfurase [Calditrichota bacterium]